MRPTKTGPDVELAARSVGGISRRNGVTPSDDFLLGFHPQRREGRRGVV